MNILKQICKDPRKAKNLLKEKEKLLNQDTNLFGKKFQSYMIDTEKAKKHNLQCFQTKTKQFRIIALLVGPSSFKP